MNRSFLTLLALFAFGVLGAWALRHSPGPETGSLQPAEAASDQERKAESLERPARTAVQPDHREGNGRRSGATRARLREDAGIDALQREWNALRGLVTGTVFEVPGARHRGNDWLPPLPFARIELGYFPSQDLPHRSLELLADSAGRYSFDLEVLRELGFPASRLREGALRLLVVEPRSSFPGHWESVEALLALDGAAPDEPRIVDIFVEPPGDRIVCGRVVTPQGEPVPGALVDCLNAFGSDERCDVEGRFRLDSKVSTSLEAYEGSEPLLLHLSDERGLASRVEIPWVDIPRDGIVGDLVLAPERLITGRIIATNGRPLPHWIVAIRTENERGSLHENARSDEDGHFAYSATHTGNHRLYAHGFQEVPIVETSAPRRDLEVVASNPTAVLRVRDPDGGLIPAEGGWGVLFCEQNEFGNWVPVRPRRGIIEDPWRGTSQMTFPEPGVYRIDTEWSGLRGRWNLQAQFEIRPGHQELEFAATYTAR